jgi:hypothetical protein
MLSYKCDVYLFVCVYVCPRVRSSPYVCLCMCMYVCVCVCVCVYEDVSVCKTNDCVYVYVCVCVCVTLPCVHVRIRVCTWPGKVWKHIYAYGCHICLHLRPLPHVFV